eukprot:16287950-Heterocapsa_arctica.AAC.1
MEARSSASSRHAQEEDQGPERNRQLCSKEGARMSNMTCKNSPDGSTTAQVGLRAHRRRTSTRGGKPQRHQEDAARQWMATQAVVWDGTEQPCGCRAFTFLHKRQKGKALSETVQCSTEESETYWEHLADVASEQEKEDEAKAAADTKRAREE